MRSYAPPFQVTSKVQVDCPSILGRGQASTETILQLKSQGSITQTTTIPSEGHAPLKLAIEEGFSSDHERITSNCVCFVLASSCHGGGNSTVV